MKKSIFMLLPVILLAGCTNNKVPTIDNITNPEDQLFETWKSEQGFDYTGDGKIDKDDYEFYKGYSAWKLGDDNFDYDGNSKIDVSDYREHLSYLKWLESDDAIDLNDDRKINQEDYFIFKDPQTNEFAQWKNSQDAKDINKDGKIDIDDFYTYKLYGSYKIKNCTYIGDDYYIYGKTNDISIKSIIRDLDHIHIENKPDGICAKYDSVFGEKYSEIIDSIDQMFSTMTIEVSGKDNFNITFKFDFDQVATVATLYFERNDNKFYTNYNFTNSGRTINVSFYVEKEEVTL